MLRLLTLRQALATLLIAAATLLAPSAQAATTYAKTRYPIVLVHGFMGFENILGVDYFYQVPGDLRANGATVYVAAVSQVNSSAVRGEQLLQQMRQWAARDGIKKFNLIGHSQGGPTARYVAGVAPELVASITTVASPTVFAEGDVSSGINDLLTTYASLSQSFGSFVAWISGHQSLPQDAAAAQAIAAELKDFAVRFPAGVPATYCGQGKEFEKGMYLYSVTGNKPKTNGFDLTDALMTESSTPSDGLVGVCSSHFGKVLRDNFPWNHFDEMNHLFGLLGSGAPDPVAFYRSQANRLKLLGL
jgi:triacylglycerol lipase